jgi:hypothetical protein
MFTNLLTSTTVAPLLSLGPSRLFLKFQKEGTDSFSVRQVQGSDIAFKKKFKI